MWLLFHMDLIKLLQNLGLEEKEAKVYLALLELGETTATKISESTALDRTLMYQIANKLISKGLVSYKVKGNVKCFSAADPEFILKNLQEKEDELKQALPELKDKQKRTKEETAVEIFKGRKGVYAMLKLVVSQNTTYHCMGGMSEACTKFENEAIAVIKDAKYSKTKGKILARREDYLFLGENEELRFVPNDLLFSTSIMIAGNKTVIFVWTEPYYAILIENEEVARSNLTTFNYLWKIGEKPSKKDVEKRLVKN